MSGQAPLSITSGARVTASTTSAPPASTERVAPEKISGHTVTENKSTLSESLKKIILGIFKKMGIDIETHMSKLLGLKKGAKLSSEDSIKMAQQLIKNREGSIKNPALKKLVSQKEINAWEHPEFKETRAKIEQGIREGEKATEKERISTILKQENWVEVLLEDPIGFQGIAGRERDKNPYLPPGENSEHIEFYTALKAYKNLPEGTPEEQAHKLAQSKKIVSHFINEGASNQINISAEERKKIQKESGAGKLPSFENAKKEVINLIKAEPGNIPLIHKKIFEALDKRFSP